ncbi:small acid-soluble spore protein I (minor) [Peribacillus deserti]|uniref:Small, acid-soluble spore protein I n=1 Tax=Peribacillus deserti TaxID=673318 RepID=A0ABS2QEI1_9BACI|nr:small acid-soluble spore protein SspI [Peribacillus deserti]MBM7691405.1 small acid-soluble spore protein I (minor) [Peribacillus deserti]
MAINIRNAVIQNVTGNSREELEDTIVDAVQSGEELMLPGLGVLFEIIWQNASENDKKEMLQRLAGGLAK